MSRPSPSVAVPLAVLLTTLAATACSSGTERPILNQFFTASRLRDATSLDGFALASFDPATRGTVTSFSIQSVSPESRRPLNIKPLVEEKRQAQAADDEFSRRRYQYQSENLDAIRRVLKAEESQKTLEGKDAEVQAEWTKLREQGDALDRQLDAAKEKVEAETRAASLSVYSPLAPVDVTKYAGDGEVVSKDVTVSASVRQPDGDTARKTLVITMVRAELKGEKPITGKWVITAVKDAAAPAGASTS